MSDYSVVGSDVAPEPIIPPVMQARISEMQEQVRDGSFRLDSMPGYVAGSRPSPDTWHNIDALEIYPLVWGRECGQNGIGKLREVALTEITEWEKFAFYDQDPAYFPQMHGSYSTLDTSKMRDQSYAYQAAMEEHGVVVHRVEMPNPPVSAYGPAKSTWGIAELFVLRGGSVLPKRGINPFAYGRSEYFSLWAMQRLGIPVLGAITGTGIAECGPSMFLAEDVFLVARGRAFNDEGIAQFFDMVQRSSGLDEGDMNFLTIDCPNPYYFDPATGLAHHPDMLIGPLDNRKVIAYPPGIDYDTLRWLKSHDFEIVEVEHDEQIRFAPANVLLIEPGLVVMHAEAPKAIAAVRKAGVEVIPIEYSEFLKEAGGLHCSTGLIWRDRGPYSTDT